MTQRSVVVGIALALFAGGLFLPQSAWAVPAFARAYNEPCSTCHTAWPRLNATGREFKENGYAWERGEPEAMKHIEKLANLPITFPLATVVKLRPYDKKEDKTTKLRALHEIELFVAGNAWNYGSFFAEFELEDENRFDFETAHAAGGFHPFQWGNLLLAYSRVFHCDPYDTLTNGRKLTRSSRQALVQPGLSGVKVDSTTQNVEVCGRDPWIKKVFYAGAYSADVKTDDLVKNMPADEVTEIVFEGEGPKDWSGRLVFDVLPLDAVPDVNLSVGTFLINGHQTDATGRALHFDRYGFDLQAEYVGANLLFAFVRQEDDQAPGMALATNNLWYVEGFYAFDQDVMQSIGLPLAAIVPSFRVDRFEKNNGMDDFTDLTFNLSVYPWENVRFYLEYFDRVDEPVGEDEPSRVTVQVELGF
ncbi:MAG: hypothetical protein ACE5HC_17060 [Candidatus Binatia bacterium]